MLINNAAFIPENIVTAFQPMHNMMKMVSTINNNFAIRKDSFTKSAELEKQMRMAMLEEETKVEKPAPPEYRMAFQNPIEARTESINVTTLYVTLAKQRASLIKKHEDILADESTSDEQRAISTKLTESLKKRIEGRLDMSIYGHASFSDGMGYISDRRGNTNEFAKIVELTGDLSAKGLGLTGFENMNSTEILEKLDGALAHLNEMGKLINPAYVPREIVPETQEDLDRFEFVAEHWDYIKAKLTGGVPKDPLPTFSQKI